MKRNLSLFERLVRPLIGLVLAALALSQPEIGLLEAVVLVLNGLLARCYLWNWLGLNTARNNIELCERVVRSKK
jgi:hypothetical protein